MQNSEVYKECANCGKLLNEYDLTFTPSGEEVCDDCFYAEFFRCNICSLSYPLAEIVEEEAAPICTGCHKVMTKEGRLF